MKRLVALVVAGAVLAFPPLSSKAGLTKNHQVIIEGLTFKPARLIVHEGDVIEWVNRDIVSHNATALDGSWTSEEILPRKTGQITAAKSGTFDYHCSFHPLMKATLIVEATSPATSTQR